MVLFLNVVKGLHSSPTVPGPVFPPFIFQLGEASRVYASVMTLSCFDSNCPLADSLCIPDRAGTPLAVIRAKSLADLSFDSVFSSPPPERS